MLKAVYVQLKLGAQPKGVPLRCSDQGVRYYHTSSDALRSRCEKKEKVKSVGGGELFLPVLSGTRSRRGASLAVA